MISNKNIPPSIGMIIKILFTIGSNRLKNKIGTIVKIEDDTFGVKFNEDVRGHDLDGDCEDRWGWYIFKDDWDNGSIEIIKMNWKQRYRK